MRVGEGSRQVSGFTGWLKYVLAAAVIAVAVPAVIDRSAAAEKVSGTAFVYHEDCLLHDTGPGHPERPARLTAIVNHLEESRLMTKLQRITPSPAPLEWITTIHESEYVGELKRSCGDAVRPFHSMDTPISAKTYEAARLAAGSTLAAIDAIMAGEVRNALCAVRPPGHHALRKRAMGFCLFNNVAIAARYIQRKYKLRRVLIVDWDVHHGNGTQAAFYDDPSVLFFSIHQYPFYPGTGAADETGSDAGKGFTVNVPLKAGDGDEACIRAFEEVLKPRGMSFDPDFVLVSAGFDAHKRDPLGGLNVTTQGYARLARIVKEIADSCCGGKLVAVLEGGYDREALGESVAEVLKVFLEE